VKVSETMEDILEKKDPQLDWIMTEIEKEKHP
jgi:hypothetical protein